MIDSMFQLNEGTRNELLKVLTQKLVDEYVFPDVAEQMRKTILDFHKNGKYSNIYSPVEMSEILTKHLQEVSKDKHIRVKFHESTIHTESNQQDSMKEFEQRGLHENFGFYKIERLQGNVGYIDLRGFFHPSLCNGLAAQAAISAMNNVAHMNALIFDVRQNGGGSPDMVALILSYLFDEPTHINSFYLRKNDTTRQYWTSSFVSGSRYGVHRPVYVLTSSYTFSAAEEFTYVLQSLKRATIIGEITAGGANPGALHDLPLNMRIFIPNGRPINPITQTNWEGVGVHPDIQTTKEEAYNVAYTMALQQILEAIDSDKHKRLHTEVVDSLQLNKAIN